MLNRSPINPTEKYYEEFARKHGYADHEMRGLGHSIVTVVPIGDIDDEPTAGSYITGDQTKATRDQAIDRANRLERRAQRAKELVADLRALVGHVRNRIESRPSAAAVEAYQDANRILVGKEPDARGGRNEVLQGLIKVLQRYA